MKPGDTRLVCVASSRRLYESLLRFSEDHGKALDSTFLTGVVESIITDAYTNWRNVLRLSDSLAPPLATVADDE